MCPYMKILEKLLVNQKHYTKTQQYWYGPIPNKKYFGTCFRIYYFWLQWLHSRKWLSLLCMQENGEKERQNKKYTVWNQPKVGFVIAGFFASQFLHLLYFTFRNLFKTEIASVSWRDVHSFGFTASDSCSLEPNFWHPSLFSGCDDESFESVSNLLAPTISPFPMSFNWEIHLST